MMIVIVIRDGNKFFGGEQKTGISRVRCGFRIGGQQTISAFMHPMCNASLNS